MGNTDTTDPILICGWSRNIDRVLDSLQALSAGKNREIVLINDQDEQTINAIKNKYPGLKFKFVEGDFTQESVLVRANLKSESTVVVLPNDTLETGIHPDKRTILATLNIKTMAPSAHVVAYITERDSLTHIRRAKADEVIVGDEFGSFMMAAHVVEPGVPQTVETLVNSHSASRFHLVQIPPVFVGKPYTELFDYFRKNHGWVLVSVFSEEKHIGIGEVLSADTSALDAFIERKLKEAGHSLGEDSTEFVVVNPGKDYLIKKTEKAIVIK